MSFINLSELKSGSTLLLQEQKIHKQNSTGVKPQEVKWYGLYLTISTWWSCLGWLPRYLKSLDLEFAFYSITCWSPCNKAYLDMYSNSGHTILRHKQTWQQHVYNNCSKTKWATSMKICKRRSAYPFANGTRHVGYQNHLESKII